MRPFAARCLLPAVALAAACALLACGLTEPSPKRQAYNTRESAFVLIDESARLEVADSPLLALDRLNRAALIYDSPRAYFEMGRIFEDQAEYRQAAAAYNEALRLAPDYAEARYAMLSLGFSPDNYRPTEEDYAIAERRAEERERRLAGRQVAEATTATLAAEQLAEQREIILREAADRQLPTLAEIRASIFGPRSAEDSVLPSAEDPLYPQDQEIVLGSYPYHYRRAQSLRRRQQYDKAAEEYELALQADPTQIDARLDLGDMMLRTERDQRALYHYQRAAEEFPASPRPALKLGNYYNQLDDPVRARAAYRAALDKDPYYGEAFNNLAVMAMKERDYDEAAGLLDELIKLDPEYANAYLNRGIIAADIEQDEAFALENFRRYVELGGERSAQVRRWIAELEAP